MLDWVLVAARLGQYAATLVLFGSPLFFLYGLDAKAVDTERADWPLRLLQIASVVALASMLAWLAAETASLTGESWDALRWSALGSMLSETRFGKIAALRALLMAISTIGVFTLPAGRRLWILEAVFGALVVGSYAWTGHGAMNEGITGLIHLAGDVVHLLAAGIWIGALLALSILIHRSLAAPSAPSARLAAASLERFSRIGSAVVAILVLTGTVNGWYLIGPAHGRELFTTAYGRTLLVKLGLFGFMLALAGTNRYRLSPQLRVAITAPVPPRRALLALRTSVVAEGVLGLLVLAAVAILGTLEPPVSN